MLLLRKTIEQGVITHKTEKKDKSVLCINTRNTRIPAYLGLPKGVKNDPF